jgi:hypothetical protein
MIANVSNIAIWVVIVSIVLLFGYNLIAAFNDREGDTIGEVIVDTCKDNPMLIFIAGVVCGHLFWR